MKFVTTLLIALVLTLCLMPDANAQEAASSPSVAFTEQPVVLPMLEPTVPVAEPAAPPKWAQDILVAAENLPVVGPVVSKVLLYLSILSSILTTGIAFLLAILSGVSRLANLAGLAAFAAKVQLFRNGRIMYWLKFASMFNAQKEKQVVAALPAKDQTKAAA